MIRSSRFSRPAAAAAALCAAAVLLLAIPSASAATNLPARAPASPGALSGQPTPVAVVGSPGQSAGPGPAAKAAKGTEEAAGSSLLPCGDSYFTNYHYSYNRTQACMPYVYAIVWLLKGVEVGKTTMDWLSSYQLNYKSRDFTVSLKLVDVDVTGYYKPLSEVFSASCQGTCKATVDWPQGSILSTGLSGSVSVHDSVGANARNTTPLDFKAVVTPEGFGPSTFTWPSWTPFRCDDELAFQGAGCVFPAYVPTLTLSRGTYGAAAGMIQWAQQHLSGAWGLQGKNKPLTRLADATTSDNNRTIICRRAWKSMGTRIGGDFGDHDSCDEYPFAATYQSGASKVKNGSQCAQVKAVETGTRGETEAQRWNTVEPIGAYSSSAACVRGHIPATLNSDVGNAYRVFIGPQRLLNSDKFWVAVTK